MQQARRQQESCTNRYLPQTTAPSGHNTVLSSIVQSHRQGHRVPQTAFSKSEDCTTNALNMRGPCHPDTGNAIKIRQNGGDTKQEMGALLQDRRGTDVKYTKASGGALAPRACQLCYFLVTFLQVLRPLRHLRPVARVERVRNGQRRMVPTDDRSSGALWTRRFRWPVLAPRFLPQAASAVYKKQCTKKEYV